MSIKSLLQFIILLLIFLIVGGIYYLYFYTEPLKDEITFNKNIVGINNEKIIEENAINKESLEEITSKNFSDKKQDQINFNKKDIKIVNENKIENLQENQELNKSDENNVKSKEIKNLTKEIEYITTNKEGDIFKILAKFGKTNIENSDILDLRLVEGTISSSKRSEIYISSDNAKYNYNNQNSEFYSNVEIKYDDKVITCSNLDLKINENYAIAYNDVKIKDDKSELNAQMVTLNILTKDININSQEKIKILTK